MALPNPKALISWGTLVGIIMTPVVVFYSSIAAMDKSLDEYKIESESSFVKKTELNQVKETLHNIDLKLDRLGAQIEELRRDNPRRYSR